MLRLLFKFKFKIVIVSDYTLVLSNGTVNNKINPILITLESYNLYTQLINTLKHANLNIIKQTYNRPQYYSTNYY